MLLDTHCHLASRQFEGELDAVIQRAKEAGVSALLTLGTEPADWQANLELCRDDDRVRCALGVHPCSVTDSGTLDEVMDELSRLAPLDEVRALGETGLDYFHPAPDGWSEEDYRGRQLEFLRAHFELAASLGKPVVLHTRDRRGRASLKDALALAREFSGRVRSQFHCHLGPRDELAKEILRLDGLLSYGGIATFRSATETTLAAAVAAPVGSFALETDAPYLAPVPHRGGRNEPAYLADTARCLAAARGESLEELAAHTTRAAREFFAWP